ncbi:hypothetical protein TDB9533_02943 [Thalassocella blandensis]|nr:hypothetical protein TDB9533_02943 [Thalassocella blandensis]
MELRFDKPLQLPSFHICSYKNYAKRWYKKTGLRTSPWIESYRKPVLSIFAIRVTVSTIKIQLNRIPLPAVYFSDRGWKSGLKLCPLRKHIRKRLYTFFLRFFLVNKGTAFRMVLTGWIIEGLLHMCQFSVTVFHQRFFLFLRF